MIPLASSEIVRRVDDAFLWMGGISLFFIVGITVTMVAFVVKYRRERHPKAARIHGNTMLEITWIVIPTFIVMFMFYKGYEGFRVMRDPPRDAMVVEVEARQWAWTFRYPQENVSSSELYVPVNTAVKLLLTVPVGDVNHSFYLPSFRTKEDCVPGYVNTMWFEADRVGTHNIFCAEFCGLDHARMRSLLHVLSQEDYERWLDQKLQERYRPVDIVRALDPASPEIQAADAPTRFATYCSSCHGAQGQGGLVAGARDFRVLEGWKRGPKVTQIWRTLTEGLEGTPMRAFTNLSAWDRFALAHHVRSFHPGTDLPQDTEQEAQDLVKLYKLDQQPVVTRAFPIDEAMKALSDEAEGEVPGAGAR